MDWAGDRGVHYGVLSAELAYRVMIYKHAFGNAHHEPAFCKKEKKEKTERQTAALSLSLSLARFMLRFPLLYTFHLHVPYI